jgi:protein SCO1
MHTSSLPAPARLPAARLSRALWVAGYSSLALLTVAMIWFAVAKPVQVLPRIRSAPAFTLVDQRGQWLADSDLRGRLVFISLGYSRCGPPCADQLAQLEAFAATRAEPLALLMISLDPEHDSPAQLLSYMGQQQLDADRWRLLTGRAAEVKALIGGEYGIYYGRQSLAEPIAFEPRIILIDENGILRAIYRGAGLDRVRVERDLELLRREASSSGLMRSVYETSHLFLCYPD